MNRHDFDFSSSPAAPSKGAGRRAGGGAGRRRGQALILAVLIMLMIALISAGFLVVVSGNLNQTARVGDKTRAVEAARSGLRFVNERLTYSPKGENWRPGDETTIPAANNGAYNLYYTAVDRAQGWAGTFAKFPDPLAPRTDAPTFLARVQRIPGELDAGDPDIADASKAGALKITVIGLSPDDPAAFHKTIAYKGGQAAPLGRFMRTVTNWDFKNKVVPSATADYDNTSRILTLSNTKGIFPPVPFPIVIGNAGSPDLGSAVVDSIPGAGQLHLASDPFGKTLTVARVELAAQLGASLPVGVASTSSAVDFNLNGTIDSGETTTLAVSDVTAAKAGGARVNGGLALTGTVQLPALDAGAGETVRVSGLMVAPVASAQVSVSTSTAPATFAGLANGSNDSTFPGTGVSIDDVKDGSDRLQNNATGDRTVAPFTPPDIASSAGVGRYRQLTRDSVSTVAGQPEAANYGYGEGIYINNPTDRERIYDGTKLRDMTQAELVKMWLSRNSDGTDDAAAPTTDRFRRSATPALASATDASLEQQHLRGWVGSDEFHGRGALVELFNGPTGAPQIAITLDSRSDNSSLSTTNALGPVDAKAWHDVTTGAIRTGVYRQVLAWPTNGVLFAEGNIRIRGEVAGAPRSLTVVSENNIYIDGALGITGGPQKVLLLARRNVVANPTAAIYRPDVQSLVTQNVALTAGTPVNLPVADSSDFAVGEVVESATKAAPTTVTVAAVVQSLPDSTTLAVAPLSSGSVASSDIVRVRADDVQNGRPVLASAADAVQRIIQPQPTAVPPATVPYPNLRIALYHNADRVPAVTIGTQDAGGFTRPATAFVQLSNNKATGETTSTDKKLQGDYSQPTTGSDLFPTTPHSSESAANGYDLTALKTAMEGTSHVADPIGWAYKVGLAPTVPANLPAFYLAGVGARGDFGAPVPTLPADFRPDISTTPYIVPLATSVATFLNGTQTALPSFDAPTGTAMTFGFSPLFLTTNEDTRTNEQSFYQGTTSGVGIPDAATNNATLDSRSLAGAVAGANTLVLRPSTGVVAGVTLPTYRAGNLKLESVDATSGDIKPGYALNIRAFVYAQTGSWFVIPAAPADPLVRDVLKLRGDATKSYFDFNNNGAADPGEYVDVDNSGVFKAGDCADLNRNGSCDAGEASAFLRYARANYSINFVGAIAENQTALVNAAGNFPGAVQAWSNSWANYNASGGNLSNKNAGVVYTFDPDYANNPAAMDAGFVMPQSDELTYVE